MKHESVVVMPAAKRPEFAALALEQLGRARHCPPIFLNVDNVGEKLVKDFEHVFRNYFPLHTGGTMSVREPHISVPSGCWNILESICDGYNVGAEYVFLVEEDILVMRDFFEYHWDQMKAGAVVSCGRRCRMFYPRSQGVYTNPGSCLSRKFLDRLVTHVNDTFYTDTNAYIDKVFGRVEGISGLDDRLIRSVIWQNGWHNCVAYPPMEEPRCAHVGLEAYENRMSFVTIEDDNIRARIGNLRKFLRTIDRNGPLARYVKDLDPFPSELL